MGKTAFYPKMPEIPEKQWFRIGEVSDLTTIKPHVLRYWETEFPILNPEKSRSNQRLYRKKDVELVFLLKKLLYFDGFTIAGARSRLKGRTHNFQELLYEAAPAVASPAEGSPPGEDIAAWEYKETLLDLRQELLVLRQMLLAQTRPESKAGSA